MRELLWNNDLSTYEFSWYNNSSSMRPINVQVINKTAEPRHFYIKWNGIDDKQYFVAPYSKLVIDNLIYDYVSFKIRSMDTGLYAIVMVDDLVVSGGSGGTVDLSPVITKLDEIKANQATMITSLSTSNTHLNTIKTDMTTNKNNTGSIKTNTANNVTIKDNLAYIKDLCQGLSDHIVVGTGYNLDIEANMKMSEAAKNTADLLKKSDTLIDEVKKIKGMLI